MKISLHLIGLLLAVVICFSQVASSQIVDPAGINGPAFGFGNGATEPAFQPTSGDLNLGLPGRFWFSANYADQGLGFDGSFFSIGAKNRLFHDALDGRWLIEARGNVSLESGGFFGNLGIERVISIEAAGADVSLGGWIDYDGDEQGSFAHSFTQVGLSAKLKTRNFDIFGNGYFPIGTTDFSTGPPQTFLGNNIILAQGSDSALRGFDATLRVRPRNFAHINGSFDIGGYGYDSDTVNFFGGIRFRSNFQLFNKLLVSAELNHDDRFDTSGVLSFGWAFGGAPGRSNEFSLAGRDLERTIRNDHIVRFTEDVVFAINPDTGAAFNVIHVDNTADANFETGAVETPFSNLAAAEAASSANDIIFVNVGDGTSRALQSGINLQDGQFLLGANTTHVLQVQDGLNLTLPVAVAGGPLPTISNTSGAGVLLADDNTVRGFNIDNSGGGLTFGILGNPQSNLNNGAIIEDNVITDASIDGIALSGVGGNLAINRNTINNSGRDGIRLINLNDPTSTLNLEDNIATGNGDFGINLTNFDVEAVTFLNNVTNDNNLDGLRLELFQNTTGNGLDLTIDGQTANNNGGNGIYLPDFLGDANISNSVANGNGSNGVNLAGLVGNANLTGVTANDNALNGVNLGGLVGNANLTGVTANDNALNGVNLAGLVGNANLTGVTANDNILNGVNLLNLVGDANLTTVTANNNSSVGVQLANIAGNANLDTVTANGNVGNGINLLNAGGDVTSLNATANNNLGNGIALTNGDGNVSFVNTTADNNLASGLFIQDWTNTDPATVTAFTGTNSFSGNSIGGINHILNDGNQVLNIEGSAINGNGFGIRSVTSGPNTTLETNLVNNTSISANNLDGLEFTVADGALQNVLIDQATIAGNGVLGGSGIAFNGTGGPTGTSQISAEVLNVTIAGTGGDGVSADFTGNTAFELEFEDSSTNANAGNGLDVNIAGNNNQFVNQIQVDNVTFNTNTLNGVAITTGPNTFTDVGFSGATFDANTLDGLNVTATGAPLGPVDNRTKVDLLASTVTNNMEDGIDLVTNGDASLLSNLTGNTLTDNGLGTTGGTVPPFGVGLNVTANGGSDLNIEVLNNAITGNGDAGIVLNTNAGATTNAVVNATQVAGNDIADDPTDMVMDDNGIDTVINTGPGGTSALALGDNFFGGFQFNSLSGAAQIEVDGTTNNFLVTDVPATFTTPAFGTVAAPSIAAEQAAFSANGF